MSGVGHLAIGFAAKPAGPQVPLLVLLAASETNDLLYFLFSSVGLEPKVATTMDFVNGLKYLAPVANPWSHGLFMSLVWSILVGALAYFHYQDRKTGFLLGLVVFSHWILDFIMHSNLPLFFGSSPLLGIGLENSGAGLLFMTVFDLVLLAGGVIFYFRSKRKTT